MTVHYVWRIVKRQPPKPLVGQKEFIHTSEILRKHTLKASDCSIVLSNSRPAARYIFRLAYSRTVVEPYSRTAERTFCSPSCRTLLVPFVW
jgi:hypothetical protein